MRQLVASTSDKNGNGFPEVFEVSLSLCNHGGLAYAMTSSKLKPSGQKSQLD